MDTTNNFSSRHQVRNQADIKVNFERLKRAIFSRKPILQEIIDKRGGKTLLEYSKDYIDVNPSTYVAERQDELIGLIKEEVARNLPEEVADSVAKQLKKYFFVSTADHFGPITSPFFVNSNLMVSAAYPPHDPVLKNIIVLSCTNISFDNSSFPRGLLFHAVDKSKQVADQQLPLFSRSVRPCPVFNFRSFDGAAVVSMRESLDSSVRAGIITTSVADKMRVLINEIYDDPEVLSLKKFDDQVVRTNFKLWKKYFNETSGGLPNLVYINQEKIVSQLLRKFHLYNDTLISHILFDRECQEKMEKRFDGIMGGFTLATKTGTYLFWALPPGEKYRQQMWREGSCLVTADGRYRVELSPEAIDRALDANEIFPSTLLSFNILAFYYGLKLLGGFNQVNYLTFMKEAFLKLAEDMDFSKSLDRCRDLQTKELIDAPTVAFARSPGAALVPATGIDLYLYGNAETVPALRRTLGKLTLEESLMPLLPDLYRVIYPEPERDPDIAAITAEDITCLLGLDDKEEACVTLS